MKKWDIPSILFPILGLVILGIIIIPILKMIISVDIPTLIDTAKDKEVIDSIWLTLKASFAATLFTIIFGIPLAYVLARYSFPGKEIIEGIIDLPVMIPHTAAGIALLTVFGQKFFLGKFFHKFGINFVGAFPGIVMAMIFVSLPFLVNSVKDGFKMVDPRLENVARTLGASRMRAIWDIDLPLIFQHIVSGAIMMWARGISEFGAVIILAYHPMVAPVLIYERFTAYGLKYARPVAVLLILICLTIFTILRTIKSKHARINRYQ